MNDIIICFLLGALVTAVIYELTRIESHLADLVDLMEAKHDRTRNSVSDS